MNNILQTRKDSFSSFNSKHISGFNTLGFQLLLLVMLCFFVPVQMKAAALEGTKCEKIVTASGKVYNETAYRISVDAGPDQSICGGSASLSAAVTGVSACSSCCTRAVSNTTKCEEGYTYAFWLSGRDKKPFSITSNSTVIWKECGDGTVKLSATNLKAVDGSGETIALDFIYSGKRNSPNGEHKAHACNSRFSSSDWVYYTTLSGSFTSSQHGIFSVRRRGTAFQVGTGANDTSNNLNFGASGWIEVSGGDGYWTAGDINVMLSSSCSAGGEEDSDVTYEWSTGERSSSITVDESGTYKISVTDCNGNVATDEVKVSIGNSAFISASASGAIKCDGSSIVMLLTSGSGFNSYRWTGPNGFLSNISNPMVFRPGTYTVIASTLDGCEASASVNVQGDTTGATVATNNDGPITCAKPTVRLNASGGSTYQWTGPSNFNSTNANPTVSVAGTYNVEITSSNGCTATGSTVVTGTCDSVVLPSIGEETQQTPQVSISDVVVNEEEALATLEICLDQVAIEFVYLRYTTVNEEAVAGSDFRNQSNFAFIPVGEQCTMIRIPLIDDEIGEEMEIFNVLLSAAINADIADALGIVTIVDTDQSLAVCNVAAGTMNATEMEVVLINGQATVLALPSGNITKPAGYRQVFVLTKGEELVIIEVGGIPRFTVTEAGKYTIHSVVYDPSTLDIEIIIPGQTTGFDVNNLLQQGGGDICASLDLTGAMIMVAAPVGNNPQVVINNVSVNEEDELARVEICLDQIADQQVTVRYTTANSTALSRADYQSTTGLATVNAGDLCTTVTFPIIDDEEEEPTEYFQVLLTAPTNATILSKEGLVTILDTDQTVQSLPKLTISDVVVKEEVGTANLEICLDEVARELVYVRYTTTNALAINVEDYSNKSSYLFFRQGEQCKTVFFNIVNDEIEENDEEFVVVLSAPNNAKIADGEGVVLIVDRDKEEVVEEACPVVNTSVEAGNIVIADLTAPIEIIQIFNSSFEIVFQCMMNCQSTEVVENLPTGDYTIRISNYNNTWNLLCVEQIILSVVNGTTVPMCTGNISNGGRIAGQQTRCGAYDPEVMTNVTSPSGGDNSKGIEYIWLSSTSNCPSELVDQIPGAISPTYDPGPITETTYFVRCSRRIGCTVWVESNCIVKYVYCPNGNITPANNRSEVASKNKSIEGIVTTNQKATIDFYPNPVRDILTVDLSTFVGQTGKAYLSNQMGQVVKIVDLGMINKSSVQILMRSLSNGLYHLTIVSEGQLVVAEKIMLQY